MADRTNTRLRVTQVTPLAGERVDFEGLDTHIRYAADNWAWCVGESTETVFECRDLEAAYQAFKRVSAGRRDAPTPTAADAPSVTTGGTAVARDDPARYGYTGDDPTPLPAVASSGSFLPGWWPIATAPRDRPIVVYAPERDGLQEMASICQWHPDAGFCIDELREPTHWTTIPVERTTSFVPRWRCVDRMEFDQ